MKKYFSAKDIAHLYLFSFCLKSTVSKEYYNCSKEINIIEETSYYQVRCESFSDVPMQLPESIPKDIDILIMDHNLFGGSFMIKNVDTFKRFPNLIRIELRMINGLEISESIRQSNELELLRKELFNLPNLSELILIYNTFNLKNRQWILPESLIVLQVMNSVFDFDLSRCTRLKTLILMKNKLSKAPILSNPLPSLIVLDLRLNPLQELVIYDVIEYCDLKHFALTTNNIAYCECVRIMEWIKLNMNDFEEFTFEGSLECDYVEDQQCSEDVLNEVRSLRHKCFNDIFTVIPFIIWLIAVIMVLAMMGALFAYVYIKIIRNNESDEE